MKSNKALFEGLIFDEQGNPVKVVYIGGDPCYVVDDAGFKRHIPSTDVDRQILDNMLAIVKDNEELFAEQTAKMLGHEDIFSWAMIQSQFKNLDQQIEKLYESGIPEAGRAYMGMMGFKVTINLHGEVIEIEQPGRAIEDEDE